MEDLLKAIVWGGNIVPTALLIFILTYWLIVLIGFIDIDSFDIDIDLDVETDVNGAGSVAWLNHVLYFFNLGQVPLMLFLSFVAIPMWFLAIIATEYLVFNSVFLSYLLLIPNFIISLFIAKVFTQPFVKLFTALENHVDDNTEVIGKICTVILNTTDEKMGQARVEGSGSVVLLNIKTRKGTVLNKGETGLVIDYVKEKSYYIIEPYEIQESV